MTADVKPSRVGWDVNPRESFLGMLLWPLRILLWPSWRRRTRRLSRAWEVNTVAGRDAWRRGQRDEAERCFRAALTALQQLEPLDPGIAIDSRLADEFRHLAMLHGNGGIFALMAAAIDDARASIVREGPHAPEVSLSFRKS